jgi:hypothetical protein
MEQPIDLVKLRAHASGTGRHVQYTCIMSLDVYPCVVEYPYDDDSIESFLVDMAVSLLLPSTLMPDAIAFVTN